MDTDKSYNRLKAELDETMRWFESEDLDVEEAIAKYQKANELIDKLEKILQRAELKIKKKGKS